MDFLSENPDIKHDTSGTNMLPLHVGFMKSRNNMGWKEFHKIGEHYYEGIRRYTTKKGVTVMSCKHYRDGCDWTGRIRNNTELTKDDDGYWDRPHWDMLQAKGTHTCCPSPVSNISKLEYRNFVRECVQNGETNYKKIKQSSKVEEKYAQHSANLLGDEDNFRKQLGKIKRKKFGGTEVVPPEYQTIKVYDSYLQQLKDVQFYHQKEDFEYFLIPDLLHELNGNISCDGTYHAVKNLADSRQIYCITKQMYSNGGKKTHCQPILCVLLPDHKQATYEKMWDHVKELYLQFTGGQLAPTVIHSDNETAFLNACKKKFPNARLLTCVYHIADNINRHLKAAGFALKNLDCPWIVK